MSGSRQTVDVLYSFPHVLGGAGIGTTAINQVAGLAAAGARVIVICTTVAGDLPPSVVVRETMRVAGRRVPHRAVGVERAWAYHDWRAAQLLARLRPLPTVVHVWPSSAVRTLAAARRLGVRGFREVPNTHTAHAYAEAEREALITGVGSERGYSHAFSETRLAREEREYDLADRLLVPSAVVADTFLARGFDETHLARHGYGFDDKRFAPVASPGDRPLQAVFMGRGEPRKGLHYALQAWRDSGAGKRGIFRIYGSFVPGYREYIEQWVDDSVQLMGFTDDPARPRRCGCADPAVRRGGQRTGVVRGDGLRLCAGGLERRGCAGRTRRERARARAPRRRHAVGATGLARHGPRAARRAAGRRHQRIDGPHLACGRSTARRALQQLTDGAGVSRR